MSSVPQQPTIEETDMQIAHYANLILHTPGANIPAIAAYGIIVAQQNAPKPPSLVLREFYCAFVTVPKPGYSEFVARFNDDDALMSFFEDRIAAAVALAILARLS